MSYVERIAREFDDTWSGDEVGHLAALEALIRQVIKDCATEANEALCAGGVPDSRRLPCLARIRALATTPEEPKG